MALHEDIQKLLPPQYHHNKRIISAIAHALRLKNLEYVCRNINFANYHLKQCGIKDYPLFLIDALRIGKAEEQLSLFSDSETPSSGIQLSLFPDGASSVD